MMLAGRYRLLRRIATGGMGTVYEGLDERLGRRVAIKILKEEYADDVTFVERFVREARTTATLDHPHITQVFDFDQDGDRHFIVMEFVDGEDLGKVLRKTGRLTPERTVEVATQACSALAAAHAAGIIHRDIKPGNVMVRPDGRVMITDFGIAQIKGQPALTGTGLVLGTAQYLSPEQAAGDRVTPASDVYSLGLLCFRMLTGTTPFSNDSPVAVALSHIREEVPSVRDLAPEVPAALAAVVSRATAKEPQKRYANAGQMERALQGSPLATREQTRTAVLPAATVVMGRPAARRRGALGSWHLVVTGVLAAAVLVLGWMALGNNESPNTASAPLPAHPSPPAQLPQSAQPPQSVQPRELPVERPTRSSSSTSLSRPSPEPAQKPSGTVVPPDAVGSSVKTLEERLKARGYEVEKVDIEAAAPKESVVATFPGPGEPLSAGQSVVLIASKGEAPEGFPHVVPGGIVGGGAKEAEDVLKDDEFEVETVEVDSFAPEDTVIATYPAPGANADAGVVVLVVSGGSD